MWLPYPLSFPVTADLVARTLTDQGEVTGHRGSVKSKSLYRVKQQEPSHPPWSVGLEIVPEITKPICISNKIFGNVNVDNTNIAI